MRRLVVPAALALLGLAALYRGMTPTSPAAVAATPPSLEAMEPPVSAPAPAPAATGAILHVVVLADDVPVVGADVILAREASAGVMTFSTAAGGARTIQGLPRGRYHARVLRPFQASASVDLDPGAPSTVRLATRRGIRLEGTVVDVSGRPVEGAAVLALQPEHGGPLGGHLSGRTDAEGRYVLRGLSPGVFDVRVRHARYRPGWVKGLAASGGTIHADAILEPGETIAGRVVDAAGAPLAGATVVASNEEVASTGVDASGRFRLEGLGRGPIACFATAPGHGAQHRIGLTPGTEDVEFRLPRAASLAGRVVCDPPPARFDLRLLRFDRDQARFIPLATERGEDGVFEISGVSPDTYRVMVEAEGFETLDMPDVTLAPGESLTGLRVRARKR